MSVIFLSKRKRLVMGEKITQEKKRKSKKIQLIRN